MNEFHSVERQRKVIGQLRLSDRFKKLKLQNLNSSFFTRHLFVWFSPVKQMSMDYESFRHPYSEGHLVDPQQTYDYPPTHKVGFYHSYLGFMGRIFVGNSEIGAHVQCEIGNLICFG